jgi:hypothetical protein
VTICRKKIFGQRIDQKIESNVELNVEQNENGHRLVPVSY